MEGVGIDTAGDFGVYLAANHRAVGLLAYASCGELGVAEEVAADAFAEAWRSWDELTRPDAPTPLPVAMRAIVERLVQGRIHSGEPTAVALEGVEPDGARIRALLAERITLIPPQDAPTVVIPRIVEPPAQPEPPAAPAPRFRRSHLIGAVVTVVALVSLGTIAMAVSGGSGASSANSAPLTLVGSGTIDSAAPTAAATSASPSRSASPSASPSASHSPSASASPSSTTASATATTGKATASSTVTTSDALSASTSVSGGNNSSWTQLTVSTSVSQTLSALTVTFDVAASSGLSDPQAWDDGSGGLFTESTNQNADGSITFVFTLASGQQVGQGTVDFTAAFGHDPHGWHASADSFTASAQTAASGATQDLGGSF